MKPPSPRIVALAILAATTLAGRAARAEPCLATTAEPVPAELGRAWQRALALLVRATATEGLPWSCAGGKVALVTTEHGVELLVTDAQGVVTARPVASPEEVPATGEALLAAPLYDEPSPPPAPAVAEIRSKDLLLEKPREGPRDPRALFFLTTGPRLSGSSPMAWLSFRGDAIVPFGRWGVGFWGRYDVHLAGPSGDWYLFRCSAFSVGALGTRRLVDGRFVLETTLDASLAVIIMEQGVESASNAEGTKPLFRLGSTLRASFPIHGMFRGVVALDGEAAPAAITGIKNIDTAVTPPRLPPVPVYTLGLQLGAQLTLP